MFPGIRNAFFARKVALLANTGARALGEIGRIDDGARDGILKVRLGGPVAALAGDALGFKRRVLISVERALDRPRAPGVAE